MERLQLQAFINSIWAQNLLTQDEAIQLVKRIKQKAVEAEESANAPENASQQQQQQQQQHGRANRRGGRAQPRASEAANNNSEDVSELEVFMYKANEKLRPLGFEIKRQASEDDGLVYISITNTKNDMLARTSSRYQPRQLNYLKKVLDLIIRSREGSITIEEALSARLDAVLNVSESTQQTQQADGDGEGESQVSGRVAPLTLEAAQDALEAFAKEAWIVVRPEQDTVTMGARSFMELKTYFDQVYGADGENVMVECIICQEMVLKGPSCTNAKCNVKMHSHCAKRWFSNKADRKCPNCTLLFGYNG